MKNYLHELYALERLSGGNTVIHRLHPTVKMLVTIIFIITVISFDRYSFGRLIPYIFYPALLTALSETPYSMLLKRFLIALPFCLFAGMTNVIFDKDFIFTIGGIEVSSGVSSFFTILFRTYLCVMAVLILVSVTPLSEITGSMRRLKTPYIFVVIFEMTYRYIGVLFEEAYSMYTAYTLRSVNTEGVEIKDMGSLAGQLLLRSIDRADRVYNAMKCRGYALRGLPGGGREMTRGDFVFFTVAGSLCVILRFIDTNIIFTGIFGGLA